MSRPGSRRLTYRTRTWHDTAGGISSDCQEISAEHRTDDVMERLWLNEEEGDEANSSSFITTPVEKGSPILTSFGSDGRFATQENAGPAATNASTRTTTNN